ncbi:serine/threonine-protein kinase RsbW [Sedimentibacter acidaminivorans]|uniref:Serine/threonine-protein kinase RsbW n=1 Tax=Sedimentibacter acidaminivorans TaxID=913099 RepID=A0ABS4GAW6_9FIRM|nr:ATP-binding protein [Sedimentibacter acidaminivorans]MBP1924836.1 serine/threonine-protein kinase RsbW [Sedimentibacter acidaminivorans]
MNYKIEKKVQSDINIVKNVVEDILLDIRDGLTESNFFNTKLILNELIINGVKHGNLDDINKSLFIDVLVNNSCLIIKVSDEGKGIKYKHKKLGEYDFCENGRGLMLVEGLADKVDINGNTVTCVQYLK